MLRLKGSQLSLWDAVLPELFKLKEELAKIDTLLDDTSFLAPFVARFNTKIALEPFSHCLFVFCNRKLGKIKIDLYPVCWTLKSEMALTQKMI